MTHVKGRKENFPSEDERRNSSRKLAYSSSHSEWQKIPSSNPMSLYSGPSAIPRPSSSCHLGLNMPYSLWYLATALIRLLFQVGQEGREGGAFMTVIES